MHSFLVSDLVSSLGESLLTKPAFVWIVSRVHHLVESSVAGLSEAFVAVMTFVWFLTCMNQFMLFPIRFAGEGGRAVATFIRLGSPLAHRHLGVFPTVFPALMKIPEIDTDVPLPAVSTFVGFQAKVALFVESSVAVTAE